MKINATKDEKGNLVIAEADFNAALDEATAKGIEAGATKGAEEIVKKYKLDEIQIPGMKGVSAEELHAEPLNEPRGRKLVRLYSAVKAIRGGTLAVEKAPKEIKLNRYIKAMWDGEDSVVKALGGQKALTEGSAADGGNLVPTEFSTELLVAIEEYGTCRRLCNIVPMTSNEIDLRTVTTKPTISRKGELVAGDEAATKFGKPELTVDTYTGHQIISREELDDNNVGLFDRLKELFAEQFAKAEDQEGLVETYYPGILGSVADTTNTTTGSASIVDVKYKELVKFKRSLSKGQLGKAGGRFILHRTILGLFEGMEDQNGRPIVTNPFGEFPGTLLGIPYEVNEVMPSLDDDAADTPFIIYGNLMWLAMGDRQGLYMELLKEATLNKAGGGTVNLAAQRARAIALDIRFGFNLTIPGNIALLKTKI